MLIASLVPGASYTSGTFTIPLSALARNSGLTITATDSVEKLLYALLQIMSVKTIARTDRDAHTGQRGSRSELAFIY